MSAITLTAGIRSNLVSLKKTNDLLSRTQTRLGTGNKVNTAVDNPNSFFKAASLNERASKLDARLDSMSQAVSAINSADQAITSMKSITEQMKAVAEDAKGETDSTSRQNLGDQWNELIVQIDSLAKDAVYSGTNFLQGSADTSNSTDKGNQAITVQFNESLDESTLDLQGITVSRAVAEAASTYALSITGSEAGLSNVTIQGHSDSAALNATGTAVIMNFANTGYKDSMDELIANVEKFENQLDASAKNLANNLNIISTRQDHTQKQINILEEGADKLTLADLNEEGANLLALNTSQELGISSLSLASQAQQGVLRLVG